MKITWKKFIKSELTEQDLSFINHDKNEYIVGRIVNSKFPLAFKITKKDDNFILEANCVISLTTYEENNMLLQDFGRYDTTQECMDKAETIIKGFIENFLTGEDNKY